MRESESQVTPIDRTAHVHVHHTEPTIRSRQRNGQSTWSHLTMYLAGQRESASRRLIRYPPYQCMHYALLEDPSDKLLHPAKARSLSVSDLLRGVIEIPPGKEPHHANLVFLG